MDANQPKETSPSRRPTVVIAGGAALIVAVPLIALSLWPKTSGQALAIPIEASARGSSEPCTVFWESGSELARDALFGAKLELGDGTVIPGTLRTNAMSEGSADDLRTGRRTYFKIFDLPSDHEPRTLHVAGRKLSVRWATKDEVASYRQTMSGR